MTDEDALYRLSIFVDLTPREQAAMRDMMGPVLCYGTTQSIRSEGDEPSGLFFLHEGWVLSSIIHPDGGRQVLKVHRAGDVLGAPSLPFETAVESLVALTPAKVSSIPLRELGALFVTCPRLAAVLFLSCQEERVMLMDRLAITGQLSAKHSVVALLLLLLDGRPPSAGSTSRLHVPLTQPQIGEVLGLSAVHVNRVIIALEREGLIKRDGRTYDLPDVPQLKRLVGMPERVRRRNPAWLPPAST